MAAIQTFSDLIKLWPTVNTMAEDIGVKYLTIRGWQQRGAIPAEYWPAIAAAAEKRAFEGVTIELMATIYAEKAGRPVAAA